MAKIVKDEDKLFSDAKEMNEYEGIRDYLDMNANTMQNLVPKLFTAIEEVSKSREVYQKFRVECFGYYEKILARIK